MHQLLLINNICKTLILILTLCLITACSTGQINSDQGLRSKSFFDYQLTTLAGEVVNLKEYAGKPALVINFALLCGTTEQINDVSELQKKYQNDLNIFIIVNNKFQTMNDMEPHHIVLASKAWSELSIYQENSDVFHFLTHAHQEHAGDISFNFEKFLVSADGQLVARFGSFVGITSRKFQDSLQRLLRK